MFSTTTNQHLPGQFLSKGAPTIFFILVCDDNDGDDFVNKDDGNNYCHDDIGVDDVNDDDNDYCHDDGDDNDDAISNDIKDVVEANGNVYLPMEDKAIHIFSLGQVSRFL